MNNRTPKCGDVGLAASTHAALSYQTFVIGGYRVKVSRLKTDMPRSIDGFDQESVNER